MNEFRQRLEYLLDDTLRQRPSVVVGKLLSFNRSTGLADVEVPNPSGPGMAKLVDLAVPQIAPGQFGPSPDPGSIVDLIIPGGNLTFAQIVAIKPPRSDYSSERQAEAKPRTYVPALTH